MMDDIDRTRKWHDNCLAGIVGPRYEMNPCEGEYRIKRKNRREGTESLHAVYFWYDRTNESAPLRCHVDGKDVSQEAAYGIWEYCGAKNCITGETYWAFLETGKWPDIDIAAQLTPAEKTAIIIAATDALDAAAPVEVSSEVPPNITIAAEIAASRTSSAKYAKIESDEEMTLAQSLRAKLQELASKADKLRVAEKEPHLAASREVDATWQPMIKVAKATAEEIRTAMEAFNDWKLEQAEKVRKAAESAAPRGQASPAPVASNAPPPSVQVSGGGGRAARVTIKKIVVSIDIDKAFAQFRESAELYEVLLNLAQSAITAGVQVDGATVEERSAIR